MNSANKPIIVIVAGGLATRMRPITEEIPKCLIDINGKPLIEHQINFFKDHGYKRFIFCVAHLASKVKEYFSDGKNFSVDIKYSEETKELLGTAGAVGLIKNMIPSGEKFIVYYGDNLTTMDFDDLINFHESKNGEFTVVVRESPAGYKGSSVITMDENNEIDVFIEKPSLDDMEKHKSKKLYINNGIYVVNNSVLDLIPENTKYDFAKDLIPKIMHSKTSDINNNSGNVFGYVSNDFFREIGRIEKYEQFKKDVHGKDVLSSSTLNSSKNSKKEIKNNLTKAIFLDRDGVINKNNSIVGLETLKIENDTVGKAIHMINESGYLAIVVTNQPTIAKGQQTIEEYDQVTEEIKKILAKDKAHLDATYVCPHHPEKGFTGEVIELKIDCDCRKPKSGMLLKAAKEYNIDLLQSWMIGDSPSDIQAGKSAGCKTIFITSGGGSGSKHEMTLKEVTPDYIAENLMEAVKLILEK